MSLLSGSVAETHLPSVVICLAGLRQNGRLHVVQDGWAGDLWFQQGRVVGAEFGAERGIAALNAIVMALPNGIWTFDVETSCGPSNIELAPDALTAHLERLDSLRPHFARAVPSLAAVPRRADPTSQPDPGEELVLKRSALATLLRIDGRRTVAELCGERGVAHTVQDLATLLERGLITVTPPAQPDSSVTPPRGALPCKSPPASDSKTRRPIRPSVSPARPSARSPGSEAGAPVAPRPPVVAAENSVCPELGFADDRSYHYPRPVRLNHCFARGHSGPVSIAEQRNLCLTERFPTCPRLAAVPPPGDGGRRRSTASPPPSATIPASNEPATRREPERHGAQARTPAFAVPKVETRRARGGLPHKLLRIVSVYAPVLSVVLTTLGICLFIWLSGIFDLSSESPYATTPVDASAPPAQDGTAGAVGTRMTTEGALPTGTVAAPTPSPPPRALQSDGAEAKATTPSPPAVGVDLEPRSPAASLTATPAWRAILDQRLATALPSWPNDPQSTAWFADGAYRLFARQPGQFVAINAPLPQPLRDIAVTATMRKVGGPAGGGYGLIVRDQGPGPRDGINQAGRFYVFAAGDRGTFGIWRRDGERWDELVPWTDSSAVHAGGDANQLVARAVNERLTFLVNGIEVASVRDAAPSEGAVGVFVGGDLNEVVLEHLLVESFSP